MNTLYSRSVVGLVGSNPLRVGLSVLLIERHHAKFFVLALTGKHLLGRVPVFSLVFSFCDFLPEVLGEWESNATVVLRPHLAIRVLMSRGVFVS